MAPIKSLLFSRISTRRSSSELSDSRVCASFAIPSSVTTFVHDATQSLMVLAAAATTTTMTHIGGYFVGFRSKPKPPPSSSSYFLFFFSFCFHPQLLIAPSYGLIACLPHHTQTHTHTTPNTKQQTARHSLVEGRGGIGTAAAAVCHTLPLPLVGTRNEYC